jgi:alpha-L-fucosidase
MYIQGEKAYDYHVKNYGHPSKFGFMEIDNICKAERWGPERLIGLYKRAGGKYFFAMGAHHDNLDMYDSAQKQVARHVRSMIASPTGRRPRPAFR